MGVSYESKVRSVYVFQAVCVYGAENVSGYKVGTLRFDRGRKWAPLILIKGESICPKSSMHSWQIVG